MNTAVWYPLAGFAMLAIITLALAAAITLPVAKAQPWVGYIAGPLAAAFALTAGIYARRTWINNVVLWAASLHPVVRIAMGLLFVALVAYLVAGLVPDRWSSVALTSGLIVGAFFAPLLAANALPPGQVADTAKSIVDAAGNLTMTLTAGWFA